MLNKINFIRYRNNFSFFSIKWCHLKVSVIQTGDQFISQENIKKPNLVACYKSHKYSLNSNYFQFKDKV